MLNKPTSDFFLFTFSERLPILSQASCSFFHSANQQPSNVQRWVGLTRASGKWAGTAASRPPQWTTTADRNHRHKTFFRRKFRFVINKLVRFTLTKHLWPRLGIDFNVLEKHSSLFVPYISYEEKNVCKYCPWVQCYVTFYVLKLRMFVISWSVFPCNPFEPSLIFAGKAGAFRCEAPHRCSTQG
jgi:hypothetical protein